MTSYALRRILLLAFQLLLALTLMFVLFRLVPGDPLTLLVGADATQDQIEAARQRHGLNEPLATQYLRYLGNLVRGDLGESLTAGRPVTDLLAARAGPTLTLVVAAISLSVFIGVPAGVFASLKPHGFLNNASMLVWVALLAIPNFWLGMLLIHLFAVRLGWLPVVGLGGVAALVLPTVAIAARIIALVARLTRASMLEVLGQDFIRTARAKGLSGLRVVGRHAFRNALIPVVTLIGVQAGLLFGGSVVIENLFGYPGMGQLLLTAATMRDYPLMQGCTLFFVAGFLAVNLLVDLSYAVIDPRIRYE